MSAPTIRHHPDATALLERAGPWLARDEATNNLLYGVLEQVRGGRQSWSGPVYLGTIEHDDAVVGCAVRTPPMPLLVPALPASLLPALVEDARAFSGDVPGVFGEADTARRLAELWCGPHGPPPVLGHQMRNWTLTEVVPPPPSAGRFRQALEADREQLVGWMGRFLAETGAEAHAPEVLLGERLDQGQVFVWEDDGPVCMALACGRTPHGMRIGYVYTPPDRRGRGHASACVAALSQHVLDSGLRFCFLYTDVHNPTSNAIYQRLGYRVHGEAAGYRFHAGE